MEIEELYATVELSQFDLSKEEIDALAGAVSQVLEYFQMMNEVDVDDLEPTTHLFYQKNRGREDIVDIRNDQESLIENAPETEDNFILIPNVL